MKSKQGFFLPSLDQPGLDSTVEKDDSLKTDSTRLPRIQRLGYSAGHVFNDLCASLWFSYLLLFLNSVLKFKSTNAGLLLLIGQVVDAIATPLVGIESDRKRSILLTCCPTYGKRKAWHLLGTVLVLISFPFIFQECFFGCSSESGGWNSFIYYSIFIAIFQIGWAAVQVAHVSLITDLSPSPKERVTLNIYRHMATVTSNICVYGIAWLVLHAGTDDHQHIGPSSTVSFRTIVLAVIGLGMFCSIIFHLFVREPQAVTASQNTSKSDEGVYGQYKSSEDFSQNSVMVVSPGGGAALLVLPTPEMDNQDTRKVSVYTIDSSATESPSVKQNNEQNGCFNVSSESLWHPTPEFQKKEVKKQLGWKQWLARMRFYRVALLYVASRLFVNISQVYMALYLQHTLALPKETLAIVPLVVNVSGLLFALLLKPVSLKVGNKSCLLLGCLLGACACVWAHLFVPVLIPVEEGMDGMVEVSTSGGWQVYGVGALFGLGGTTLLVSSLAITADMIGTDTKSSAFVFGTMSFFDKLSSGGAILFVQYMDPMKDVAEMLVHNPYYRTVLVLGCGSAVLATVLGLLITAFPDILLLVKGRGSKRKGCPVDISDLKVSSKCVNSAA